MAKKTSNKGNNGKRKKRRSDRIFWERYTQEVYPLILSHSLALANGDMSKAEDIVQTVIMKVLSYVPDRTNIRNALHYLKGIARNVWIDSRRSKEVSLDEVMEADPNNLALAVPPDIQQKLEDQERLGLGTGASRDKFLITVKLRGEGYTFNEIAKILGERVSKTKFRYYRHMQQIRDYLRRQSDRG